MGLLLLAGDVVAQVSTDATTAAPVFLTQLGGASSDTATAVAIDSQGCVYVAGWTRSGDFPTTPEAPDRTVEGRDAFVAKFGPDGQELIWSTVLGGRRDEQARTLLLAPDGRVLVGGWTNSDDFPTHALAHRQERQGGQDGFVTALDPDTGQLLASTYVGGSEDDAVTGLALASDGDLGLTGWTRSRDLPTLDYVYQPRHAGRRDAFVLRLDGNASQLRYATYLGGGDDDEPAGLGFDAAGYLVLAGTTRSRDFPVTPGAFDDQRNGDEVFVARLAGDGRYLMHATYFGGSDDDRANGFTLGEGGEAIVAGVTRSKDLPTTGGQSATGRTDGFVVMLPAAGGAPRLARRLGGSGTDSLHAVTLDALGGLWVGGVTASNDLELPFSAGQAQRGGSEDGILARLDPETGDTRFATYVGGTGVEQLRALAPDPFHGGVALAGLAERTRTQSRGPFGGSGSAGDAYLGRFVPGTCGVPAFTAILRSNGGARLESGFPHQGRTLEVELLDGAENAQGLLFLGTQSGAPLALEGKGTVYVETHTALVLSSFTTDAEGAQSFRLPVPSDPDLCGMEFVLQGLVEGLVTDALVLTVGS